MNRKITFYIIAIALISLYACDNNQKSNTSENSKLSNPKPLVETVLTAEEQEALSPDDVIKLFKAGNLRFTNNNLAERDHSAQVRKSTNAQFPKAIILSCIDSRVPVEDVFDRGIGDVFVARVAGNFVNVDMLGSLEYACKVSGSKLILVLGHEHCGAIKAAIDGVVLGNITAMLSKIKPAIKMVSDYKGEQTSKNAEFVHMVCESNVKNTINEIRTKSPILKKMEDKGEIKIVGAVYDMDSGKVVF